MYEIKKNTEDIINTIIINIIKMITERGLLLSANLDNNIEKYKKQKNDDNLYKITLDNKYGNSDEKQLLVKIVFQKITGLHKVAGVNEFLLSNRSTPKILVVTEINQKIIRDIYKVYPHTEIFSEYELMINIIDHEIVPKHIPLSKKEIEEVYKKYNVTKVQMPKIFDSDPISRYYNMKVGDMFRIVRLSGKSGQSVIYRLVVKGPK